MSDGFFSRWSRLKREAPVAEPVAAPVAEPLAVPVAEPVPAPVAEPVVSTSPLTAKVAEAEFDITTLPDIETATAETDFTAFLRKGVPEFLKRQALRRAWCLDPGIRDFVGPADYAWDFNAEGGVPGFSLVLGGDVKKLLAQAIGQLDLLEVEAPQIPSFLPPGTAPAALEVMAEAPPPDEPLRLAAAPEPEPEPEPHEPDPPLEVELVPPRRHGGAIPV